MKDLSCLLSYTHWETCSMDFVDISSSYFVNSGSTSESNHRYVFLITRSDHASNIHKIPKTC